MSGAETVGYEEAVSPSSIGRSLGTAVLLPIK